VNAPNKASSHDDTAQEDEFDVANVGGEVGHG